MYCSSTMLSIESTSIGSSRSRLISHNAATALRSEMLLGSRLWDPALACRPLRPTGIELRLADVGDREPHSLALFWRHCRALHGPLFEGEIGAFSHALPFLFQDTRSPRRYSAGIFTVAGSAARPVSAASSSSIERPLVSIAINQKAIAASTYQAAK